MDLEGSVAVVTGASRGIGKAAALALAAAGADVVCAARSVEGSPSRLPGTVEETARAVQALGGRALAVPCDVARDEDIEALARRTLERCGRVDILVNNAAVNYRAAIADTEPRRWDVMMNVNLRGAFLCAKAFLPAMMKRRAGCIINVSSGAVTDAEVSAALGIVPYAVSKAGVEQLTQGLAAELRPYGIAANCLRIEAAVATEGARAVDPGGDYTKWETPEAVAEAIVWLARQGATYTGRVVTLAETRLT